MSLYSIFHKDLAASLGYQPLPGDYFFVVIEIEESGRELFNNVRDLLDPAMSLVDVAEKLIEYGFTVEETEPIIRKMVEDQQEAKRAESVPVSWHERVGIPVHKMDTAG